MANEDLIDLKTYCVVCTSEIPPERLRFRSVTCKDEHAKLRQRQLRKKVDDRECRFCHKPSTPSQRRAFARFRKWERENVALAYPEAWRIVSAAGMSEADFGKAIQQAAKRDVDLTSDALWNVLKPYDKPTPELDAAMEIVRAAQRRIATTGDDEPEFTDRAGEKVSDGDVQWANAGKASDAGAA